MEMTNLSLNKSVQVFGDSILRGSVWNPAAGRYVTLAENGVALFRAEFGGDIDNQSRFGCTAQRGCVLLERELQKSHAQVCVLEYGGNDCNFNWKEISEHPTARHDPVTSPAAFEALYRRMISAVREAGKIPVVMSLLPLDAGRYFAWITRTGLCAQAILEWLGDVARIYRFQEMYAGILERVAFSTKTPYVDVRSAFLAEKHFGELFCVDGIHPNKAGHNLIARRFGEFYRAVSRETA